MSEGNTDLALLDKELQLATTRADLIDVYRERLGPSGMMGRALQWSPHVLIIERVNDDYFYDGLSAIRPSDITRIRAEDRELRAASKLIAHERTPPLDDVALLELSASITILSRRYSSVAVHTEALPSEMSFVGEPEAIDDDFLVLRAWGTARTADTYRLVLRLAEITRVDADTQYIRRLHEFRRGQG